MKKIKILVRNIALISTSILSGILLFIFSASIFITSTILTPDFHMDLFEKYDLYSHAETAIDNTLKNIFKNSGTQINQFDDQQKELLNVVENSTSPQMVRMNLDSIREGIFQYFRGDKNFLPDIYIDTKSLSDNNIYDDKKADEQVKLQSKIKKINLSAILLSLNRKDISDYILLVKLVYFIISYLPVLSLALLALLSLISFILCNKPGKLPRWLFFTLIIAAILCIISAVFIFAFLYRILPSSIYINEAFIVFDSGLIISYIKACLSPVMIFSFSLAAIFITCAFLLLFAKNFLQKYVSASAVILSRLSNSCKKTVKYCITAFLFIFVLFSLSFKLYGFYRDFNENNLSSAMLKITNKNTTTQVISAKDETIYTLQIKLIDSKTGKAIPNIKINVSGKSEIPDRYNNVHGITDEKGVVKFTLGKGNFNLVFSPVTLPCEYMLPTPFFYELKSVGTTIVTINLDLDDSNTKNEGIVEIEVLGDENLPVENLELAVISNSEDKKNKEDMPDKHFSITNKEGLSVFKLSEGKYHVEFSSQKFPEQYTLPEPFNISISRDITTRYTIRLVKKTTGDTP
ncbi:MAG: hypothetical protein GX660_07980 [Clostridiaceae bacterium]|nr:hypothetical protein [Clostridiaceae bacterium]